ncbi:hypothetical protein EWH99_06215 [Sporolactobacillus sp. THM7-7]|nr:hypothetical protein EWH99_06215 [Sporolactobacillus sp. THM7-7]
MPYDEFLLLHLVGRFKGERTLSGIYHLLKGKKSSQTIQDSYLFHVEPFFHSLDGLKRQDYDWLTGKCLKKRWIEEAGNRSGKYRLSESGADRLKALGKTHSFPSGLDFTEHVNEESVFWLKLQLAVQTVSELVHGRKSFFPVTRQALVTESVRVFLRQPSQSPSRLALQMFVELRGLLSLCPREEADILVLQMTGFGMGGLTFHQLSCRFSNDLWICRLLHKSALRRLLHHLSAPDSDYPCLRRLLNEKRGTLSLSAGQTYDYLRQGKSMETIARLRKLSRGTIEDHIVELVLKVPSFDCSPYLPEEVNRSILSAARQAGTYRLKPIKHILQDRVSYFQIRLALAKSAAREGSADE